MESVEFNTPETAGLSRLQLVHLVADKGRDLRNAREDLAALRRMLREADESNDRLRAESIRLCCVLKQSAITLEKVRTNIENVQVIP